MTVKKTHLCLLIVSCVRILIDRRRDLRAGVAQDPAVFQHQLPFDPGRDLPGRRDLALLSGYPFFCECVFFVVNRLTGCKRQLLFNN